MKLKEFENFKYCFYRREYAMVIKLYRRSLTRIISKRFFIIKTQTRYQRADGIIWMIDGEIRRVLLKRYRVVK